MSAHPNQRAAHRRATRLGEMRENIRVLQEKSANQQVDDLRTTIALPNGRTVSCRPGLVITKCPPVRALEEQDKWTAKPFSGWEIGTPSQRGTGIGVR